ncbi:MAG TPA: dioxygenase [Candidatus Limnocylindria bacterium]
MIRLILASALVLSACTVPTPGTTGASPTSTSAVASSPVATPSTGAAASASPPGSSQSGVVVAANCKAPATPTTESTEGPYFKAGSPEKASLVTAGMTGTKIQLIGLVLTRSCKPVTDAKVDIWQANANGEYDNTGYTLRGYVRADANGQYRIETIVPGKYPGRTPHIHVKVTAGGKTLTTQLYMPDESSNTSDSIFRPELAMQIIQGPPMSGAFAFILDLP